MSKHIIIAIDPDVNKSGVSRLNKETKEIKIENLNFPELLEYLLNEKSIAEKGSYKLTIVVESAHLVNKSNWHNIRGRAGERIAKNVGACHQVAKMLVECAKHYELRVIEQLPLRKIWKGKDRKITHDEIVKITGYSGRTNQETRDAMLLSWHYADLPFKI